MTNLSPMIDELGSLNAQIAALELKAKAIKEAALCPRQGHLSGRRLRGPGLAPETEKVELEGDRRESRLLVAAQDRRHTLRRQSATAPS